MGSVEGLPEPFYQDDLVTLYHSANDRILAWLDEVDHVITDPPYSEHVHANGRTSKTGRNKKDDVREVDFGFTHLTVENRRLLAHEFGRICQRWAIVFCDLEGIGGWIEDISQSMEYIRTGIWVKSNPSPQFTGDRPGSGAEAAVIAYKLEQKKRWNGGGKSAVWGGANDKRRHPKEIRYHPTQKPLWLMADIVSQYTDPGETILDPFAGSGSTLLAARALGRKSIGIEASLEHCNVIRGRILSTPLLDSVVDLTDSDTEMYPPST